MKYRKLEDHELVQAGDHYFAHGRLVNQNATSFIGQPQSDWTSGDRENQWRRPIKEHKEREAAYAQGAHDTRKSIRDLVTQLKNI